MENNPTVQGILPDDYGESSQTNIAPDCQGIP